MKEKWNEPSIQSTYFVRMIAPLILAAIIPASSQAADWSILEPETVCSHLDWTGIKKVAMVGAGENVADVREAMEALKKNIQDCPKVSSVITAKGLGDVVRLDDASIVARSAELPIDLVLIVRVDQDFEGQSSLFATFFDTKGEKITAIAVDSGPAFTRSSSNHYDADTARREQYNAGQPFQEVPYDVSNDFFENRHSGFFFRANLGLGFGTASSKSGGDSMGISGLAAIGEFSAGYPVIENLVFHVSVNGPMMIAPEVSVKGHTFSEIDVESNSVGFGLGLTYYFMPYNFYLTMILGTVAMEGEIDGEEVSTEKGFSAHVSLGKEWWVSPKLGLGVAGALIYQRMKDGEGSSFIWNNVAVGLLFSATYF